MDVFTREKRSEVMSLVRSTNTQPERRARSVLHRMGYRFRLHARDLPGTPDIVLPRHRTVLFVHGCFWHRHARCPYATTPKTRQAFWRSKFEGNVERDRRARRALRRLGWKVGVVWECELRGDDGAVRERLERLLPPRNADAEPGRRRRAA